MTVDSGRTLGGLLQAKALARGDDTFVHYRGTDLSFAELDALATRAAQGFARLGVRMGDRVGRDRPAEWHRLPRRVVRLGPPWSD